MELWFLEADPQMGFIKAGYSVKGKRYVSLVCSQAGRLYVSSGAKITGDHALHWFSEEQTAAYNSFIGGQDLAVEFKEAIQ